MKKQHTHIPVALRFRRWSRKAYAAFISIQRIVNIGNLTANVSERFQTKNGAIHTSVLAFDCTGSEKAAEENEFSDERLQIMTPLWQSPALFFVQTVQQAAVAVPAYSLLIHTISYRAEGFSNKLESSAFCLDKQFIS